MTGQSGTYVVAIDQGTTSSRAIVFDTAGAVVASAAREHAQILPRPGWVEHDPLEIWRNVRAVLGEALAEAQLTAADVAALGITNQRETTVVWDVQTGRPVHNAIVWQDTRTGAICDRLAADGGIDRFRARTGLPLSTYFSGPKVAWILEHVDGARAAAEAGRLRMGTMDSWLIWNLSGGAGARPGVHVTDVTNASRTLLMDLETLSWDREICAAFDIPVSMLPTIASSVGELARVRPQSMLAGTPITGVLGDQQAALFGQTCLAPGEAKNTYGTGNFLLVNTGTEITRSTHGLLTTVAYRIGDQPPVYALEGSVAVTGSLVQWLRDQLGLISSSAEVEQVARSVDDNGGVYLVPAFSGLFAPRWRPDARGVLVGLTRHSGRGHIARAALEATAYQTREVLAAADDSALPITELRVDGGMVANELLMQFQADILDIPVVRPQITETTALGAAYAAGLAVGVWADIDTLRGLWREGGRWTPQMAPERRAHLFRQWNRAVERSYDWVEPDEAADDDAAAD